MRTEPPKLSALYLASRPPFPPAGGRERLILQSIEFLASEYDLHVVVFCLKDERHDLSALFRMGVRTVQTVALPGVVQVGYNMLTRRRYSLQENLFYSRRIRATIRTIVPSGVNVVIADMLRTGQYCDDFNLPKVIDLDDLLSERYGQFLANGHRQTVFGTFSRRVPSPLRALEPFVRRRLLRWEREAVADREVTAPRRFDVTLLTSSLEAARLRSTSHADQIHANPQATPLPGFLWAHGLQSHDQVDCFFLGNLRTSQNLASLSLIAESVMPLLVERGVDVRLHIVGDYDARIKAITQGVSERITWYGFVYDFSGIVARCTVALLPIVEGTGVKTKVLDAMAMGIPVLTNRLGIEGLSVKHEREVLLAETADEICRAITRLAADDVLSARLSAAARHYVE
ncbi:Glycosyl transferase, group 1 family protein [Candidatus Burkholderia verschuerenii]|uniref:Glycosyl transferase, group 1 family protein n=1 Tax=Candidatus Burkholderia verschuerenii TaxID=242163 RepID=A0A0L0MCI2_9BURK|nr:glycosyltransferase [Candidatus Burkholderia verschuerenii]KND60422.1 Glycosyl transferase, group 1 family protein [Candidatus Burkholderia verschuerenii]